MKTYTAIAAAILAIFVLDPSPGAAADVTYHSPKTAAALRAADLLQRGARAVSAYLAATDKDARVTDLWLFPTNDANSLFVEYRNPPYWDRSLGARQR